MLVHHSAFHLSHARPSSTTALATSACAQPRLLDAHAASPMMRSLGARVVREGGPGLVVLARPFHIAWPMRSIQSTAVVAAALLLTTGCQEGGRDADADLTPSRNERPAELDCGVAAGDVQIDGGVGVLRIGVSVEEVRERCTVIRDTTVLDNEGMPARWLVVLLDGDTAVAEIAADRVWRLRLTTPRFRTSAGLGVGTRISELVAIAGARALVGEGEIYVTVPAICGVSYRITGADFARVAGARSPELAMAELPEAAHVDLLLVMDCAGSPEQ